MTESFSECMLPPNVTKRPPPKTTCRKPASDGAILNDRFIHVTPLVEVRIIPVPLRLPPLPTATNVWLPKAGFPMEARCSEMPFLQTVCAFNDTTTHDIERMVSSLSLGSWCIITFGMSLCRLTIPVAPLMV